MFGCRLQPTITCACICFGPCIVSITMHAFGSNFPAAQTKYRRHVPNQRPTTKIDSFTWLTMKKRCDVTERERDRDSVLHYFWWCVMRFVCLHTLTGDCPRPTYGMHVCHLLTAAIPNRRKWISTVARARTHSLRSHCDWKSLGEKFCNALEEGQKTHSYSQ